MNAIVAAAVPVWKRLGCPVLLVGLSALWGLGCRPAAPTAGGAGAGGAGGMPAMQVVVVEARRQPVTESVSLVGTLAANEEIEVKAETDGTVEEILFEEGQVVEAGQLLVRLEETKLTAQLAEAEARLKLGQANFDRARQLLGDHLISQQEFDQAASAFEASRASVELQRRQLKDARISAPFRGRTGARSISPGQVITRNTTITWLVDLDPVKVEMGVPERFLSQTRVGQKVDFGVAAYPGQRFGGEIYFIAPRLDEGTRTALVKTRVTNPDGLLKSGMVAGLELKMQIREAAILVPEVALISNGDQYFVFLMGEEDVAKLQPVRLGERLPRWVEVTEGVREGDRVVVEGHQKVAPGMKLSAAPAEKAAIYRGLESRETPAAPGGAPAPGR